MRKESSIAVIVVNYQGAKDTIECIKSIHDSSVLVDVIVVDNASDGKKIEEAITGLANVQMIVSPENLGFAGGNNLGIKYAMEMGYEYITLLNNDTIVDRHMFAKLRSFAREDVVTLPVMYYYDLPDKVWYSGGIIDKRTGTVKHIEQTMDEKECIHYWEFATGCCMMIHRNIIDRIGGLDESFFMYCEDEEYSLRLKENDINIAVISGAKLWHKIAQSSGKDSPFFEYYLSRNRILCIKKHRQYFVWTAYIYSMVSRIVKLIIFFVRRDERYKSDLYAIIDAVRDCCKRRY